MIRFSANKTAGVKSEKEDLEREGIVMSDALVHSPPELLDNLQDTLFFIDSHELLSSVFDQFG